MLFTVLQLESQGEDRESPKEAVLMMGYSSDGLSNQEQTRWLSRSTDEGLRGFDLARNPGLNIITEYGAGEFPLPTKPATRTETQSSKPLSIIRSQQTDEAYPDIGKLKRELEKHQRKRDQAAPDGNQAALEREIGLQLTGASCSREIQSHT